ncbi:glyceraldehyde 3-phosphate dehydrogenase NAD-binding domain-containing protein, partial [uncultured Acinetobacter sp.]|uniref:glyceraldehyde 3-phosphate dehydrogenase NAD-binding domain-containing protein n=1 Tax=uncultured Acinetobacter sp. TaxID=165433 RepID=UPI00263A13A3
PHLDELVRGVGDDLVRDNVPRVDLLAHLLLLPSGARPSNRIGDRRLFFSEHAHPAEIPWGDLGVDLVLECTGKFLDPGTLEGHLRRGAKRVIVAAPVSD